jgi:hypothetical protein
MNKEFKTYKEFINESKEFNFDIKKLIDHTISLLEDSPSGFYTDYAEEFFQMNGDIWNELQEKSIEDPEEAFYFIKDNHLETLQYFIEATIEEYIYDLEIYYENSNISIYREISCDDEYLYKLKEGNVESLGIYWSFEEDTAEAHWAKAGHDRKILFVASVNGKHIDVEGTLTSWLHPYTGKEERELRILEGSAVSLIEVKEGENKIKFKNKEYKA